MTLDYTRENCLRKYSTFDRKLLAVYQAVLHFNPQIEGKKSHFVLRSQVDDEIGQTTNILIDYNTVHFSCSVHTRRHVVADSLSRPTCSVIIDHSALPVISDSQNKDDEIDKYKNQLKPYEMLESFILCNLSIFTLPDRAYLNHNVKGSLTCFTTFHIQDLRQRWN